MEQDVVDLWIVHCYSKEGNKEAIKKVYFEVCDELKKMLKFILNGRKKYVFVVPTFVCAGISHYRTCPLVQFRVTFFAHYIIC